MVSQYGTREGESICLALPKEPPTEYDMALQRNATEGRHMGKHIRKGRRKVRSLYSLALKEPFDGTVGAVCGGKWGKEGQLGREEGDGNENAAQLGGSSQTSTLRQ